MSDTNTIERPPVKAEQNQDGTVTVVMIDEDGDELTIGLTSKEGLQMCKALAAVFELRLRAR